ncbi:hypothetical protein GQ457_04G026420 [Hibiscus cannabinus]
MPNKTIVSVGYAGTIRLSDRILLRDVLYVPEFRFNLLVVSSLIKDTDLTVLFSKSHFLIQGLCQVIGKGEFYRGLYLLQLPRMPVKPFCSNDSIVLASWHDRLGHPSSSVFHFLKNVLPYVESNKNVLCTICPLAKQKPLSFHVYSTVTNTPFELVHSSIIPSIIAMIKWQYGFDLKVFRSDNAPKLRFSELFSTLGILHQYSCVETPQQNYVVERKHQHLLAVARALFFQARIPTRFWGDCVLTATYVINRLPSKVLNASRDKFTERALAGVFIGYAPRAKGYKVYILQTHTIVVSRNVVSHEGVFPFHTIVPADALIDPFPEIVLPHIIHDISLNQNLSFSRESTASLHEFDSNTDATGSSPLVSSADNVFVSNATDNVHDPVRSTSVDVSNRVVPEVIPTIRQSSRVAGKPSYLQQYFCSNASSSSCLYHIEDHVSTSWLSPDYTAFISNISSSTEHVFYHQPVRVSEWRDAMQDELRAMDYLKTWSVVSLPSGKKAIDCKWVYRIKRKVDGSIDRYKARLAAKGFTQIEGVDYTDTFSPVAKMTSFKLLLAWLQYMTGICFSSTSIMLFSMACMMKSQVVLCFGFSQSPHEHSLFVKGYGDSMVALLVYVDDIILAGKDLKLLAEVQNFLQSHFKLKDLGNLKYFLGFEIARNKSGISLSQRQYALQLLEDIGSLAKKPTELPIVPPHKLSKDDGQLLDDPQLYRRMVWVTASDFKCNSGLDSEEHTLSSLPAPHQGLIGGQASEQDIHDLSHNQRIMVKRRVITQSLEPMKKTRMLSSLPDR